MDDLVNRIFRKVLPHEISEKTEKLLKNIALLTRFSQCNSNHIWLVSSHNVFVFSILCDLDLLCMVENRTPT